MDVDVFNNMTWTETFELGRKYLATLLKDSFMNSPTSTQGY